MEHKWYKEICRPQFQFCPVSKVFPKLPITGISNLKINAITKRERNTNLRFSSNKQTCLNETRVNKKCVSPMDKFSMKGIVSYKQKLVNFCLIVY